MAAIELGPYRLEIAEGFGPRVTGLTLDGGVDLFARLDDSVAIDRPGRPPFRFRGGHRLWASPEVPSVTYATDDHECRWSRTGDAVRISADADEAGVSKEISISLDGDDLRVDHRLTSTGSYAAWGITQLRLGGMAILTLPGSDTAPLPDRVIVVWPYTDLGDPRLHVGDDHIAIEAAGNDPVKIGFGPARARLGYLLDGWLFEKRSEETQGEFPDLGAISQVYVGQGFCELETMGALPAGQEPAVLTEWWHLSPCHSRAEAVERLTTGTTS